MATFAKEASRVGVSAENEYESDSEPIVVPENDSVEIKAFEPANIQVSEDGHVLDTPEVAQAKAEHLAAFEAEKTRSGYEIYNGANVYAYNLVQPIQTIATQYHIAAPVVAAKAVEIADIKLSADGYVLDTPEVAQAKADHLAQFAADAARAAAAGGDEEESNEGQEDVEEIEAAPVPAPAPEVALKFDDPPANIQVSSDGFILDTPEVAEAKALHLQEVAKASSESESASNEEASVITYDAPSFKWAGPAADIRIGQDGFVQDTAEVAQAKAAHLQEVAKAGAQSESESIEGAYVAYTSPPVAYLAGSKWTGPPADVKISHDGFVQDTAEVSQARAEHLATRASIMANSDIRYASGQYIAETSEVAAARAAHLAEHAKETAIHESIAKSAKTYNYGQLVYSAPVFRTVVPQSYAYSYHPVAYRYLGFRYAPAAHVAFTSDGKYLADTPEVTAEKIKHFEAHAKARGW